MIKVKKYNILGSQFYQVKIIYDKEIVDMECKCIWGKNNPRAFKENRLCKHMKQAKRIFEMEQFNNKKKTQVVGLDYCPKWLKEKYLKAVNKCQICKFKKNLEIHRIKRGVMGGKYTVCPLNQKGNNVMILCSECHKLVHGKEPGMK